MSAVWTPDLVRPSFHLLNFNHPLTAQLGHHPLQFRHLLFVGFLRHGLCLTVPPCVIDPFLVPGKMLDHVLVCFRPDRYDPAQCSVRSDSGQKGLELIPGDSLKFFRTDPQPVLRQKTGNDQIPVLKQVVVRVTALPVFLPPQ